MGMLVSIAAVFVVSAFGAALYAFELVTHGETLVFLFVATMIIATFSFCVCLARTAQGLRMSPVGPLLLFLLAWGLVAVFAVKVSAVVPVAVLIILRRSISTAERAKRGRLGNVIPPCGKLAEHAPIGSFKPGEANAAAVYQAVSVNSSMRTTTALIAQPGFNASNSSSAGMG